MMAPDDAAPSDDTGTTDPDAANRPQDPFVARRRPDPAQPPAPTARMLGFLGDSYRPGFRRLYFTRDLDYYAEFRADDVLQMDSIPADQPPFPGDEATRLTLRRDATVEYTRIRTPHSIDEFDADVRLGRRFVLFDRRRGVYLERRAETEPNTWCHDFTCYGSCPGDGTCETCVPPCPEQLKPPFPSAFGEATC
jgi:hypothetical protein